MKKIVIFILIMLIIIASIFGFYLYSAYTSSTSSPENLDLESRILSNSSWIELTEEDFYGYLNGTYTEAVQKIINSLEEAIPVIIHTSNDKFGDNKNGNFIIASAFNTSNQIYTYYYNIATSSYRKTLSSLESLLEDAIRVYIYDETEGL